MQTDEYRLMQNPALGSLCLWAFIERYWREKNRSEGAPFVLLPIVLPVTFHRETVELLHGRRFDGGLLNALADDQAFPIGLQQRVEDMFDQTCEAVNVGLATNLFAMDPDDQTLSPVVRTRPSVIETRLQRQMFATAERLAHWFANYPLGQICGYLQLGI